MRNIYSTKLSRTMFIMIAVSLGQSWSVASKHRIFSVHSFYAIDVSQYLLPTLLQYYAWPILSLILSYRFRMSILREAVGKLKLNKQSKEYKINGSSWNNIFYNYFRFSKMNEKKMPVMIVILKNKIVCLYFVQFFIFFYLQYALLSVKLDRLSLSLEIRK